MKSLTFSSRMCSLIECVLLQVLKLGEMDKKYEITDRPFDYDAHLPSYYGNRSDSV